MRYTHLSLDDFGCFSHAQMRDIEDGLTVIAGPQRAGKTTFMKALRALPYGISRGDSVPPASNAYRLGGSFEHGDGLYNISLDGYSPPTVATETGAEEFSLEDVRRTVTKQRYQQLFTLSLDELQRLPEGVEDEEDLSEILLGAAYQDIAAIPEVRDNFDADAEEIAGKNGNVSYKLNGPIDTIEQGAKERDEAKKSVELYERTRGGLKQTERGIQGARRTIARRKKEKERLEILDNRYDTLTEYQELRSELEESSEVLDLDSPEDVIETIEELEQDIGEAQQRLDESAEAIRNATDIDSDDTRETADAIVAHSEELESYDAQIEKWRQQETDIEEEEDALGAEQDELERRVTDLKSDWDENLVAPMGVTIDQLSRGKVREVINDVREARDEVASTWEALQQKRTKVATLEEEKADLEDELNEQAEREASAWRGSVKSATITGGGVAAVGVLLGLGIAILLQPLVGAIAALAGLLAGIWHIRKEIDGAIEPQEREGKTDSLSSLETRISERKGDREDAQRSFTEALTEVHCAERDFRSLTDCLDLERGLSPKTVQEFYENLDALQADIESYRVDREELEADRCELEAELVDAAETTEKLAEFSWDDDNPVAHSEQLYAAVQEVASVVDDADAYNEMADQLESYRSRAETVVGDWTSKKSLEEIPTDQLLKLLEQYREEAERATQHQGSVKRFESLEEQLTRRFDSTSITAAFEPYCRTRDIQMDSQLEESESKAVVQDGGERHRLESAVPWPIEALESLVDEYPTRTSIEQRLEEIEKEINDLNKQINEYQEAKAEKRQKLSEYSSDEDIKAAQARIDEGRTKFERLYEEYAINRIGQELTEQLYHRFMDEAAGPLLEEASDIFAEITGTYDGIGHDGDLTELQFQALQEDGQDRDTGALSRATAEQLFLSLRLARIRQFDVALPIVVDDAMTNFDPHHARRTLAFLDELTKTNQVFLTTCHPETLQLVEEQVGDPSYYTLVEGQFREQRSSPSKAIKMLQEGPTPN